MTEWNGTFSKVFLPYVLIIFQIVLPMQRQMYNCYYSFKQNILPYSTSSQVLFFFYKSESKNFTIASLFKGGCYTKFKILFETIRKMGGGEETTFLDS